MGKNINKILGIILIVMSGIIYTMENITEKISSALVATGYAITGIGVDRTGNNIGLFENFFVWLFLLVGFILLASGFSKERK
ncbi:hypothetical protein ACFP56_10620 [Paenibacillus septentrionalis]|uniref:Uncharacterized protein n=1 Tax=Paenibacillus septentrionalis TaxID=429342 RepID=A0ABW1V533_9BACL